MPKSVPYLDCNASTPLDEQVWRVMQDVFPQVGNASSVHTAGRNAAVLVDKAAANVAKLVGFTADEVTFTSGATEANGCVLLGLMKEKPKSHLLFSPLEHASVRQCARALADLGHEVETLLCDASGRVSLADFSRKLRPDTALVSVMAVSNLTSIRQPLEDIAARLSGHGAFFYSDAAQEVGKRNAPFPARLDGLSISAHKMYGPQGIGAFCVRKSRLAELVPLLVGGGQQQGRRGGTLPVALIAGFGEAALQASLHFEERRRACLAFGEQVSRALVQCNARVLGGKNGFDDEHRLVHGVAAVFPGVDAEMAISALQDVMHVSLGSACDAAGAFEESPALSAMGLCLREQAGVLRLSWCHRTAPVDWAAFVGLLKRLSL